MLENFGSLRAGAIGLSLLYCSCSVCSDPLGEEGHNDPAKQTQEIEKEHEDSAERIEEMASKINQWSKDIPNMVCVLLSMASEKKEDKHKIEMLESNETFWEERSEKQAKKIQRQKQKIQELKQEIQELKRTINILIEPVQSQMIERYKELSSDDSDD